MPKKCFKETHNALDCEKCSTKQNCNTYKDLMNFARKLDEIVLYGVPEKPNACPFCGGKSVIGNSAFSNGQPAKYVYCVACLAQTGKHSDEKKAIEAWNRRINDRIPMP